MARRLSVSRHDVELPRTGEGSLTWGTQSVPGPHRPKEPPMYAHLNRAQPYVLGLFRIVVGLLFACHGAASLFGVLGGATGGGTIPVGTWPHWYAALIQLVGGTLV